MKTHSQRAALWICVFAIGLTTTGVTEAQIKLGPPKIGGGSIKPKDLDPFNKNGKLREKAAELDKKRLEKLRAIEYAASEKAYYAFRDHYISANIGIIRQRLKPGTLVYRMVEPFVRGKVDLKTVEFNFGAKVPPDMGAVTFNHRIFIKAAYNPDDPNLGLTIGHELAHTMQYQQLGGEKQFARRYWGQIAKSLRKGAFFNMHDSLGLEKEAIAFEKRILDNYNKNIAKSYYYAICILNDTKRPINFNIRRTKNGKITKETVEAGKTWMWYVTSIPAFEISFDGNAAKGLDAKRYSLQAATFEAKPSRGQVERSNGSYIFQRDGNRIDLKRRRVK